METIHETTRSGYFVPFGVVSWIVLAYSAATAKHLSLTAIDAFPTITLRRAEAVH